MTGDWRSLYLARINGHLNGCLVTPEMPRRYLEQAGRDRENP